MSSHIKSCHTELSKNTNLLRGVHQTQRNTDAWSYLYKEMCGRVTTTNTP